MKLLNSEEVHAKTIQTLGLDHTALDLGSVEGMAACIRRIAGSLCPCPARTIIQAILQIQKGLCGDKNKLEEFVEEVLASLIGYGDLLEYRGVSEDDERSGFLVYLAPPAFVKRQGGGALILGVVTDRTSPLPDEIASKIEFLNHIRSIPGDNIDGLHQHFRELGLIELHENSWLKAPSIESPDHIVDRLNRQLSSCPQAGDGTGFRIIDSTKPSRYYRGRWVDPKSQTGVFIARRPQAYGADLWCVAKLSEGNIERFFDLEDPSGRWRGCDIAWRILAALDSASGNPQTYRIRTETENSKIIDIFIPPPQWLQRRWDAIGAPSPNRKGVASYCFIERDVAEETAFLRNNLWLIESSDGGSF